jgi:DNA-binding PadR family transcriptional regulator
MSVRFAVLGLLSAKGMHGYQLKTRFDRVTGGFWQLNFGQIYSTLDRLAREGLVERSCEREERDSDRKIFRITVKGKAKLDDWILRPVAHPRALRDDLFVRLLFSDRSSAGPILRLVARQRDVYDLEMRKLSKRKAQLEKMKSDESGFLTDLLIDAALFHAEAELSWLSHVEQKVNARWSRAPQKRTRT